MARLCSGTTPPCLPLSMSLTPPCSPLAPLRPPASSLSAANAPPRMQRTLACRSIGAIIVADAAVHAHLALPPHSKVPYPSTAPSPGSRFGAQNDAAAAADVDACTGLSAPGRTTLVRSVPSHHAD